MTDAERSAPEAETQPPELAPLYTLDLSTLTLGEMSEAERQSDQIFDRLMMGGNATRRLLALWVHEYRNSAQPRSWPQLAALRVFGRSSSPRPPSTDGPPSPSSD
jgi:hypothetical protein